MFPAHAGMIPAAANSRKCGIGVPRTSGDDPAGLEARRHRGRAPPHAGDDPILAFASQLFESNADTARVVHRPFSEAERVVELVRDVVNRFAPNSVKALCVRFVNEPSREIAAVELIGHERVVLFRPEKEHLSDLICSILTIS